MKIKGTNVFRLVVLVLIVFLFCKLVGISDKITCRIDFPYYLDDPVYGLMFLGLICVTLITIIKLIINR